MKMNFTKIFIFLAFFTLLLTFVGFFTVPLKDNIQETHILFSLSLWLMVVSFFIMLPIILITMLLIWLLVYLQNLKINILSNFQQKPSFIELMNEIKKTIFNFLNKLSLRQTLIITELSIIFLGWFFIPLPDDLKSDQPFANLFIWFIFSIPIFLGLVIIAAPIVNLTEWLKDRKKYSNYSEQKTKKQAFINLLKDAKDTLKEAAKELSSIDIYLIINMISFFVLSLGINLSGKYPELEFEDIIFYVFFAILIANFIIVLPFYLINKLTNFLASKFSKFRKKLDYLKNKDLNSKDK